MKRDLPPYVYRRGPRGYTYFERAGVSQRIKARLGTPEFHEVYAKLIGGASKEPEVKRNFAGLIASYRKSDRFTRLKPRTQADYEKVLAFIEKNAGHMPVKAIQRKDVIRAQQSRAGTVRFANYIAQVFSVILEHSIDKGWREDNPAKGVRLIKSDSAGREPWPPELIEAFRRAAPPRARLIFELALGTGQRIGDVLKMRWGDLEQGGIHVSQGKTKAALWVPIRDDLATVLAQTPRTGLTIVTGRYGRPVGYRVAADEVMSVRKLIGAEKYDIHALRYTKAAQLAEEGHDDETIKAITGHASGRMVAKYAGPTRQKVRAMKTKDRK